MGTGDEEEGFRWGMKMGVEMEEEWRCEMQVEDGEEEQAWMLRSDGGEA